jgi:hypothetical protein
VTLSGPTGSEPAAALLLPIARSLRAMGVLVVGASVGIVKV